ncbi:hypothetical protein BDZ94DRAFT_1247893 [Collybia nuda]|uniref:DUF6533 domain-containing protein n=1 Tax=Collybia nuda TaxID=64659 RepID=A0A9P5YEL9_9AGAR|nr:hypothetical protein BDZ94DRAFT_1247893 [Collybia nuda]
MTNAPSSLFWSSYVSTIISFTILSFDYLLTCSSEVGVSHVRKLVLFSILFLCNRYISLSTMAAYVGITFFDESVHMIVSTNSPTAPSSNRRYALIVFSTVTVPVAEVILILRVYAVYQNKFIAGLLLSVWIVHIALMVWMTVTDANTSLLLDMSYSKDGGILFMAPAIVFDTIVGGLLTLGVYWKYKFFRMRMPLTRLIAQDGLLYFAAVFATNITWTLVHFRAINLSERLEGDLGLVGGSLRFIPLETQVIIFYESSCITTTMIGRLTLNLRMYDPAANDELTFQALSLEFGQPLTNAWTRNIYDTAA